MARRCIPLLVLLVALHARAVSAQGHGYIFLGAGTVDGGVGVDYRIPGTPVGVGGELAGGQYLAASLAGSFHFLDRRRFERLDLFARAGYTALTDLNYDAVGLTVGGGVVYWPRRHIGLRLDWTSFLPLRDRFPTEGRVYWGVRGGVAFGWR